jgi:uncharacterized protein YoxC
MELLNELSYFIKTETPFMLLFSALFIYFIKTSKEREKRMHELVNTKLDAIQEEMHVLIRVWKILLEKELEEKKK